CVVQAYGISRQACAKETAQGELVCTMHPISGNALYNSICVAVSLEGFKSPSTTSPSKLTTTIFSGVSSSYSTPLGLMTINPFSRSIPLTFPQVKVIKLYSGKNIFAL